MLDREIYVAQINETTLIYICIKSLLSSTSPMCAQTSFYVHFDTRFIFILKFSTEKCATKLLLCFISILVGLASIYNLPHVGGIAGVHRPLQVHLSSPVHTVNRSCDQLW